MAARQSTDDRSGADAEESRGNRSAELLAKADLFSGVDRVTLAKLAANLDPITFAKDQAACKQGEVGDSLYLVSEGSFGVFVSSESDARLVRVATIGRGACFGEMALLTGEPRSATVLADGAGELLRLDHERFAELVRRDPSIGLALSASLSRRLRTASQSIKEADAAVRGQVERQLAQVPGQIRTQILQASLLNEADATAMQVLFGAAAADISAQLVAFGWVKGKPPPPIASALREAYAKEAGADAVRAFARIAIESLAEAGSWRNVLELAERYSDGPAMATLLGRALRSEDKDKLAREQAAPWLARLSDAEAADDAVLAVERAAWHGGRGAPEEAFRLLRRALPLAQARGDGSAIARIEAEIARYAEAVGAVEKAKPRSSSSRIGKYWNSLRSSPRRFAAIAVCILFILAAILVSPFSKAGAFVLLLGGAITLWVVAILPEFVVYLGLVIFWVFLGIATPGRAVAGFGSTSWISIFAILAIASALSASGLVYRLGLMLVRRLPQGLFAQGAACLVSGLGLTLMVPSSTARTRLILPTALAAAQSQRFKDRSPESAYLGLSSFIGASPLLYIFLNGSSSNFLGLGLIPEAIRARFDLAFWFIAAAPLALFTAVGSLGVLWLILRPSKTERMSHQRIDLQLSLLGPLSAREIAMSVILAAMVVGFNVGPSIGISTGVIGLASLVAAALVGCFDRQSLQSLNWDFLISYGVILSLPPIISLLGIDTKIASALGGLIGSAKLSALVFVLSIALLNLSVRLLLPDDQTLLLLSIILIPMAPVFGVHPWVVVITLLATFTLWLFPSQTASYAVAYEASEGRLFTQAQARKVCIGFIIVTLVGLVVMVPYWRLLKLISATP
jgi:CRP-like cAMP-binding protein/di/tricarboxylate transporter